MLNVVSGREVVGVKRKQYLFTLGMEVGESNNTLYAAICTLLFKHSIKALHCVVPKYPAEFWGVVGGITGFIVMRIFVILRVNIKSKV